MSPPSFDTIDNYMNENLGYMHYDYYILDLFMIDIDRLKVYKTV